MTVLLPMPTVPSRSSKTSVMILFRNILKRVGETKYPCRTPTVTWNQSLAAVKEDCTGGLIIEDSDKFGANVALLRDEMGRFF